MSPMEASQIGQLIGLVIGCVAWLTTTTYLNKYCIRNGFKRLKVIQWFVILFGVAALVAVTGLFGYVGLGIFLFCTRTKKVKTKEDTKYNSYSSHYTPK